MCRVSQGIQALSISGEYTLTQEMILSMEDQAWIGILRGCELFRSKEGVNQLRRQGRAGVELASSIGGEKLCQDLH